MDEGTISIVASNLTVAYCSTMIAKHGPGTSRTTTADTEFDEEKIMAIYLGFRERLKQ